MSDENIKTIYDAGVKAGIQGFGDFDYFKSKMKNPENIPIVYGALQKANIQGIGDLEFFSAKIKPDKSFFEVLGTKPPEKMSFGDIKDWETAFQYGSYLGGKIGEKAESILGEGALPFGKATIQGIPQAGIKPLKEKIAGSKIIPEKIKPEVTGIGEAAAEFTESLASPLNALLMGLGGTKLASTAIGRVAPVVFSAMMGVGAAEQAKQFKILYDAGDRAGAAKAATLALADGLFAYLGIRKEVKNLKLRRQMRERLAKEMEDAFIEEAEWEEVSPSGLEGRQPPIGPRQAAEGISGQLPPTEAQPGLPPGPEVPPRIGPRQTPEGVPPQLPYRAEGGPIVTPTPGEPGTALVPQSWVEQVDRIRKFVEEPIQRPPLKAGPPLVIPTPKQISPAEVSGEKEVPAVKPGEKEVVKARRKKAEASAVEPSKVPASFQTLYDRGFTQDQVFRMSGPDMALVLEQGLKPNQVSITPSGKLKVFETKPEATVYETFKEFWISQGLPWEEGKIIDHPRYREMVDKYRGNINSQLENRLMPAKIGEFNTQTYDYIFNELKRGVDEAIANQINPNDYLDYLADKSPELPKYIDKFREEMGLAVVKEYKGFDQAVLDFDSVIKADANIIKTKIDAIKSGIVNPPDINGAFWQAKPLLDNAWEIHRKAMLPVQDFVDAILEQIPKEAHPILRRWIWSADDVSLRNFTKDSPFIDMTDTGEAEYFTTNHAKVDWNRYEQNRQLAKIAANTVAAYDPPLMKFVKNVELIPYEMRGLLGGSVSVYNWRTGTLGLSEMPSTTIEKTIEGIPHDIEGVPTFSEGIVDRPELLKEHIRNIAHEAQHNLDKLMNTNENFRKLFEGEYVYQEGEIRARRKSREIKEEAEGSRTKYFSMIADAIAEVGKGLNEILKGMFEVAGTIGAFSEESYQRAKPHFINAWKLFKDAHMPFFEFRKEMVRQFGSPVERYIDRFGIDIGLTPGPNRAMQNLPETSETTKPNFVKRFGQGFMDAIDVEAPFKRQGAAKTGNAIKNWFSTRAFHEEDAVYNWGKRLRELIKEVPEDMSHVVLEYENPGWVDKHVAVENRAAVKAAAQEFGRYFKQSQKDYAAKGVTVDFKQRLLDDLDALIQQSAGDEATLASLAETRKAIEYMNFVHVPASMWFTQSVLDIDPARGAKMLRLLAAQKRKTYSIRQLLDEGLIDISDVNPFHIIASYARRKGRDMAALDIINAGKADRLVLDKSVVTGVGNVFRDIPGYIAPMFSRYKVHPLLADWIYDLRNADYPRTKAGRIVEQAFNYTKAAAFYNPGIIAMNDIAQAAMLGYLRNPLQWKWLARGMKDALTRSPEYWEALEKGVASEPMNMPFRNIYESLDDMSKFGHEHTATMLKKMLPHKALQNIYKVSQLVAWQLDRGFRTAGYRYCKEQLGMTPEEAASTAAKFFGDYASVPPRTRRKMNRVFFTPTYKIVMGKLYGSMMKGMYNNIRKFGRVDKTTKVFAGGLIGLAAIYIGTHVVMKLAGFNTDEFGRRYTKTIDTERGPRELVLTWGNPANMFSKYLFRIYRSFQRSNVKYESGLQSFFEQSKFELHPIYLRALDLSRNRQSSGEQIWNSFDKPWIKAGKGLNYAIGETVKLIGAAEALIPVGESGLKDVNANKALAKDFGWLATLAMEPFSFSYVRGTKTDRMMSKYNKVKSDFQYYLEKGEITPERAREYQKTVDAIMEEGSK